MRGQLRGAGQPPQRVRVDARFVGPAVAVVLITCLATGYGIAGWSGVVTQSASIAEGEGDDDASAHVDRAESTVIQAGVGYPDRLDMRASHEGTDAGRPATSEEAAAEPGERPTEGRERGDEDEGEDESARGPENGAADQAADDTGSTDNLPASSTGNGTSVNRAPGNRATGVGTAAHAVAEAGAGAEGRNPGSPRSAQGVPTPPERTPMHAVPPVPAPGEPTLTVGPLAPVLPQPRIPRPELHLR